MTVASNKPSDDQIEVTLIGPGYGECGIVHIGGGQWAIIDSCVNVETNEPVALEYLQSIGVDPEESVRLIIASHWHDDHIRGLSKVVASCPNAVFCSSSALTKEEFLAFAIPFDDKNTIRSGSGVREWMAILDILQGHRTRCGAIQDRLVYQAQASELAHGKDCLIFTLSPSDKMVEHFLLSIADKKPKAGETKYKAPAVKPNHSCVVTWVSIGETNILFGGDLEETGNPETGWSVIVNSNSWKGGKASILKVPHHGSANGHNDDVWDSMLIDEPFAILTPYNHGAEENKLPKQSDVERIVAKTSKGYSTARLVAGKTITNRSPAVERTIREVVKVIRRIEPKMGMIRLRGPSQTSTPWEIKLFGSACPLEKIRD